MEIIGYTGALAIGLSLGLIGGGGSILTIPVLVFLFGMDPVIAAAYSLFIVGITSLAGSFSHIKLGNIDWKTAVAFGIPSIISIFLTRMFVVPVIPKVLFSSGSFIITKSVFLLLLFAILMLFASYSMIKKSKKEERQNYKEEISINYISLLVQGIMIGIIAGLVGAGGGFLIIPALVVFAKLPMKKAIGTSLIIIAFNSLIGFGADLAIHVSIDWIFLFIFSIFAIAGIIAGGFLSKNISEQKLKPAFGWFVLAMGTYIIVRETIKR